MVGEDGMKEALKAASAVQKENAKLRKVNPALLTVRLHLSRLFPRSLHSVPPLPPPVGPLAAYVVLRDVKELSTIM